jgi:hypothetical protein
MRSERFTTALVLMAAALAAAPAVSADREYSQLELSLACAPPPSAYAPGAAPRVLGGQDPAFRTLFDASDLLVIDAGTASGVQQGQRYYIRRPALLGVGYAGSGVQSVHTAGWVRIVAAHDTTALAAIEHTCDGIDQGDYLEPFVAPVLPAGADLDDSSGEPDFTAPARVLFGERQRAIGGGGDFMLIDRGTAHGVAAGDRFAIYRDVRARSAMYSQPRTSPPLPLALVGEAVAVATGPVMSLVRITSARDAVLSGDLAAPRRK